MAIANFVITLLGALLSFMGVVLLLFNENTIEAIKESKHGPVPDPILFGGFLLLYHLIHIRLPSDRKWAVVLGWGLGLLALAYVLPGPALV